MNCEYSNKIAMKCGINSALLASFLWDETKDNGQKHHNRVWAACSQKKLMALYPFMKEKADRGALHRLIDAEILFMSEYNESRFDRTASYAFTTYGKTLMEGMIYE